MVYKCFVARDMKGYSDWKLHAQIGKIIRAHSENKKDVRDVLKGLINWSGVKCVLDIGCGYGWFEEALDGYGLACIVGVDCAEENSTPFVAVARRAAKKGIFQHLTLPASIAYPSGFFDLVISTYSLYFFPTMIAETYRLLREGGCLAVITHSEGMMEEGEGLAELKSLKKVIGNFSAENGEAILKGLFRDIKTADYNNGLVFRQGDEDNLTVYIDFKKEFITESPGPGPVKLAILSRLEKEGRLRFNKNDRIFIAQK